MRKGQGHAKDALNALGIDKVCESVCDRKSLTKIAEEAGVSIGSLLTWIGEDPERSARVREARVAMAKVWDEKAESEIAGAKDAFELSKAKELAQHYRWRASKIGHREYGDKLELEHSGTIKSITDEELDRKLAEYAARLAE